MLKLSKLIHGRKKEMKNGMNDPKQKYIIKAILHSGRKGSRNTQVSDPKYESVVGSIVTLYNVAKLEDYKLFDEMIFDFIETKSEYDWWSTTPIIELARDYEGIYKVETVNTIYEMEEVN